MRPGVLHDHRGIHDTLGILSQHSHTFLGRLAHRRNGNWLVAPHGKRGNRGQECQGFYSNLVPPFRHAFRIAIVRDDTMNRMSMKR